MADDDKPLDPDNFEGIVMSQKRAMCGLHALPFKEGWPAGAVIFSLLAFKAVIEIDSIHDEARRLSGVGPEVDKVPVKALELVFDAKPICCRLPHKKLAGVYVETKRGKMGRCKFCGRKDLGTPIETEQQGLIKHVCFDCMSTASPIPYGAH